MKSKMQLNPQLRFSHHFDANATRITSNHQHSKKQQKQSRIVTQKPLQLRKLIGIKSTDQSDSQKKRRKITILAKSSMLRHSKQSDWMKITLISIFTSINYSSHSLRKSTRNSKKNHRWMEGGWPWWMETINQKRIRNKQSLLIAWVGLLITISYWSYWFRLKKILSRFLKLSTWRNPLKNALSHQPSMQRSNRKCTSMILLLSDRYTITQWRLITHTCLIPLYQ